MFMNVSIATAVGGTEALGHIHITALGLFLWGRAGLSRLGLTLVLTAHNAGTLSQGAVSANYTMFVLLSLLQQIR